MTIHINVYCGNNPINMIDPTGLSGVLTIYANESGVIDGHAWIAFTPDSTGVTTSYGTWGNNPGGQGYGLLENVELNNGLTTAEATRMLQINDEQEAAMMDVIRFYEDKGNEGWKLLAPYSAFAQDAWDAGTGEYLNANTWIIINNPATLKKSIIEENGGVNHNTPTTPVQTNNSSSSNDCSDSSSNSSNQSSGSTSRGSGESSNSSVQSSFVQIP